MSVGSTHVENAKFTVLGQDQAQDCKDAVLTNANTQYPILVKMLDIALDGDGRRVPPPLHSLARAS